MQKRRTLSGSLLSAAVVASLSTASFSAYALNGYFAYGYGTKALGRGGASLAFTDDAFGGANNPATISWVGNRFEAGVSIAQFVRGASRSGSAGVDFSETSGRHYFGIPEMAFSHRINDKWAMGVTLYANGGLNTQYDDGQLPASACTPGASGRRNLLCGTSKLGMNLNQVFIAPTLAYRLTPDLSFGFTPLLAVQSFKAEGLQFFAPFSTSPNNFTNKGTDYSYGYGARVGVLYRPMEWLSLGAAYSTRTRMTPLNRYKGLFANGGRFDVPANFGVGVVVSPARRVKIGLDWIRIQFGDVSALGNPSDAAHPFGSRGGPGFGWRDVNVYKLGIEFAATRRLDPRFGYNHVTSVFNRRFLTFSVMAPGAGTDHLTAGLTYRVTERSELSAFYARWIEKSMPGLAGTSGLGFGGAETLRMQENSFGIQYAWRF